MPSALRYDAARRAELWLFEGDWSTRGTSPRLESSDFVPTEKQWRVREDLVVRTREEFARTCRDKYQQGYRNAKAEELAERQRVAREGNAGALTVLPDDVRQDLRTIGEVARLEEEVTRAQRMAAENERRYQMAKQRADAIEEDYRWYHREANAITKRLLTDEPFYRERQAEYLREHPGVRLVRYQPDGRPKATRSAGRQP